MNIVTCRLHGDVLVTLKDHVRYATGGCEECNKSWQSSRQRMPLQEFILRAQHIWGKTTYDYSSVHPFGNQHELVWIKCLKHQQFFSKSPANHLHKSLPQGCPMCAIERTASLLSSDTEEFVTKAMKVHGGRYDYSRVKYERSDVPIEIWCNEHHEFFTQRPSDHLSGKGCRICGIEAVNETNRKLTTEVFVKRCKEVWGDEYDYSVVEYVNDDTPIKVICEKHGIFSIDFQNHTYLKRGCRKCGSRRRGKETAWLDSLGIPDDELHREVTIKFEDGTWVFADGFVPETNTVYEFWGDFWHGNPKFYPPETKVGNPTAQDLFEKTNRKRANYFNHGYHLVEIWEHEWDMQAASPESK